MARPRTPSGPRLTTSLAVLTLLATVAACTPGDADDAELEQRVAEQEALIAEQEQVIAELEQRLVEAQEGTPAEEVTPDPDPAPRQQPADARSEEGVAEQLWTLFPEAFAFPEGEGATTGWQADGVDIPEGFRQADEPTFATPGELLVALVDEWNVGDELGGDTWELTVRVFVEGPEAVAPTEADVATGAVLLWGFADDAVAGEDRRLELRRGDDGWYVASGEARFHCRRGVSDDLCV